MSKIDWLPPRYRFQKTLEQHGCYRRLLVSDVESGKSFEVETLPESQFKSHDLFRLEVFIDQAKKVRSKNYLSPVEWCVANEQQTADAPQGWVYLIKPYLEPAASLSQLRTDRVANFQPDNAVPKTDGTDDREDACKFRQTIANWLGSLAELHRLNVTQQDFRLGQIAYDDGQLIQLAPSLLLFAKPESRSDSWSLNFGKTASPELLGLLDHDVSCSSDIYSAGVVLHTIITGQVPFDGDTLSRVLVQQLTKTIELEPSNKQSRQDSGLLSIVKRMLAKNPKDRYQSFDSVIHDLEWLNQNQNCVEKFVAGWTDVRDSISEPLFVGRQSSLNDFREIIKQVRGGVSKRVLLTSDEGIGKTRFLSELFRETELQGMRTWRCCVSEQSDQRPVAPFSDIISAICDDVEICQHLRIELTAHSVDVAQFFPRLAAMLWPADFTNGERVETERSAREMAKSNSGTNQPSRVDGFEMQRLHQIICQIVSKLSRRQQPAILWIDDAQWLDSPTAEVLQRLSRWKMEPTLIVLSATNSKQVSSLESRLDVDIKTELQPLNEREMLLLLDSMTGSLPRQATDAICSLALGNPFMAEAILRGMVETGVLRFSGTEWVVDPELLNEIQASSDSTEVLLHRLKSIPSDVTKMLSVAAISGRSFHASTLSSLSKRPIAKCYHDLAWARKQKLVWSKPDGSFAFVHERIRNALVQQIPVSQRKLIHKHIAELFVVIEADSIDIATHFDLAGMPEHAFHAALESAAAARKTSSLETALRMLLIAWKGVDRSNGDASHHIAAEIGEVLMLCGKYGEGESWFNIAEETAASSEAKVQLTMKRGELLLKQGDKIEAVTLFESALEELGVATPKSWLARRSSLVFQLGVQLLHTLFPAIFLHRRSSPATRRDRLKWRIYSQLSYGYGDTRSPADTFRVHLCGMNSAESFAATPELAQAWSDHAFAMSLIPLYKRGSRYSLRSLQLRNELKDRWGRGQTQSSYSVLLHGSSKYGRCISQSLQAEETLSKTGDYWQVNIARYQRAASLYRMGNLKESLELAKRTYEEANRIGDYRSTGNILDVWTRASLGNIPFEIINTEKKRRSIDKQRHSQMLLAEGVFKLGQRLPLEAIVCFEEGVEVAKIAGISNSYVSPNYAWLATALRLEIEGQPDFENRNRRGKRKFLRAANRAVRIARRFKNDLPHALRELGYACALLNREAAARRFLKESLNVATDQRANYEAALTRQAFERLGLQFKWRMHDNSTSMQRADCKVREFEASVTRVGAQDTVSVINRFDALLDAGRKITSSLNESGILRATIEAGTNLLRGERTLIVKRDSDSGLWEAWRSTEPFDRSIVSESIRTNSTVIRDREKFSDSHRSSSNVDSNPNHRASVLCSPIISSGSVVACIYVANSLVEKMFGDDEARIVEFLVNAAGSSLEKEASFKQLDQLNSNLEQKVRDRTSTLESRTRELEQTAQKLRATQQRLEQTAEAAEAANQTKSDFLAKMSHEIRTPISAVLGFAQLILRGIVTDKESQRQKIEQIESNGQHLLQLVNDLLDISKIEADQMAIEKIECYPIKIAKEVVESLRSRAVENGNSLHLQLIAPLPKSIHSDPKRFRQILTNLIGNAIKFTSDGDISVQVSFQTSSGGKLCVDVIDSGIGMTDQQIDSVFAPFVQADSSITRRFGGTGLGLSISRELAAALGGSIEVSSRIGQGSKFHLEIEAGDRSSLQLLEHDQMQPLLASSSHNLWARADLSSLNILLADDAQTNRDLISLVLRDCGANVMIVENGRQAVDTALNSEHVFELVLMDMQMPQLDGYSATRELRDRGFEAPIFALTANSMLGDREKCLAAGCTEYLTKPINLNLLIETLAQVAKVETTHIDCFTKIDQSRELQSTTPTSVNMNASPIAEHGTLLFDGDSFESLGPLQTFAIQFFETMDKKMPLFRQQLDKRDKVSAKEFAHWLKGTSGTVQLSELAAVASEMERAIRADDWDSAADIFKDIEEYSRDGIAHSATMNMETAS